MTDHFAVFNEPRRPWLDTDALKEKFHALTSRHHPDVAPDASVDFAALNAAYQTLRDPCARTRHLLELEFPETLAGSRPIPAAVGELFMHIGALTQRLDVFFKKQMQAASPLTRALLEPEKLSLLENLQESLAVLSECHTRLIGELRALDAQWEASKTSAAPTLAALFQSLSYVSKWTAQLREGVVKLAN